MKINVGVIFGGRSVENEISVITAAQTMAAMNTEKYNIVPIYISKEGHWYTGDKLRTTDNYRDMKRCRYLYRCYPPMLAWYFG